MKFFLVLLVFTFSFFNSACFADSSDAPEKQQIINNQLPATTPLEEAYVRKEYLAEQKVRMLPSKHGDTIDSYMNNMVRIPMAQDLGWKVHPLADGYEVERSIQINNSKIIRYKWKVSNSGEVNPVNDNARKLMK